MSNYCPNCNAEVSSGNTCDNCGATIADGNDDSDGYTDYNTDFSVSNYSSSNSDITDSDDNETTDADYYLEDDTDDGDDDNDDTPARVRQTQRTVLHKSKKNTFVPDTVTQALAVKMNANALIINHKLSDIQTGPNKNDVYKKIWWSWFIVNTLGLGQLVYKGKKHRITPEIEELEMQMMKTFVELVSRNKEHYQSINQYFKNELAAQFLASAKIKECRKKTVAPLRQMLIYAFALDTTLYIIYLLAFN